jgi:two-component system cell cycle response regulator DivK
MQQVLSGKRIFYIEDDVKNRSIAQMILEQSGATVGFERWGKADAINKLLAFYPVDVILLDLMFPRGVTGYDVFEAIQAEPLLADIPVIAVSASDPALEIPRLKRLGFAGFISKPIDIRLFPQQISHCINGELIWYAN